MYKKLLWFLWLITLPTVNVLQRIGASHRYSLLNEAATVNIFL